jgi:hypothetical protein
VEQENDAGELATRRVRARIGREPAAEELVDPQPTTEDWPPEELLTLHDRYDVSHLELRSGKPLFGRLLTRVRRTILRPVLDLAAHQSEVNALTARVLSELANRTEELRAAQADRLKAEQAVRTLRQRIASLESALADLRRRDQEDDERERP